LLSIAPLSFFLVLVCSQFLTKSSKIKFLKNSIKIFLNFYFKNGAERHLGDLRGTYHATSPLGGTAQPWPRPPMVRGPPGLSLISFSPALSLSRKTTTHQLKLAFLLLSFSNF
jgi:hypothetical protein